MISKTSADLFKSTLAPCGSATAQHKGGFYLCTCFRLLHKDFASGTYSTSRENPGFLSVLVGSYLHRGAEEDHKIFDCPVWQLGEGHWWGGALLSWVYREMTRFFIIKKIKLTVLHQQRSTPSSFSHKWEAYSFLLLLPWSPPMTPRLVQASHCTSPRATQLFQ